ncbi:hypothetical protein RSAG8_03330, partial [Rhizoctonia solani AG-8 WAC10335]
MNTRSNRTYKIPSREVQEGKVQRVRVTKAAGKQKKAGQRPKAVWVRETARKARNSSRASEKRTTETETEAYFAKAKEFFRKSTSALIPFLSPKRSAKRRKGPRELLGCSERPPLRQASSASLGHSRM